MRAVTRRSLLGIPRACYPHRRSSTSEHDKARRDGHDPVKTKGHGLPWPLSVRRTREGAVNVAPSLFLDLVARREQRVVLDRPVSSSTRMVRDETSDRMR